MQSLLNVPAEVVSANINAAVAKAAAKKRRIFVLGIMAGAFIAMRMTLTCVSLQKRIAN